MPYTGLTELLSGTYHQDEYPLSGYSSDIEVQTHQSIYMGTSGQTYDIFAPTYSGYRLISISPYTVGTAIEYCDTLGHKLLSYSTTPSAATGYYWDDDSWELDRDFMFNTITCSDYNTGDAVYITDNTQIAQSLDSINYYLFRFVFLRLLFKFFNLYLNFVTHHKYEN